MKCWSWTFVATSDCETIQFPVALITPRFENNWNLVLMKDAGSLPRMRGHCLRKIQAPRRWKYCPDYGKFCLVYRSIFWIVTGTCIPSRLYELSPTPCTQSCSFSIFARKQIIKSGMMFLSTSRWVRQIVRCLPAFHKMMNFPNIEK